MCSMIRSLDSEKAITGTPAALVSNRFVLGSEVQHLKYHREHIESPQKSDRELTGKLKTEAPPIAVPMEHLMEQTNNSLDYFQ